MEKNQETKTEIILPSKEETQALAATCQLHWKDVRYNIAVFIKKVGNALAGESIVADHVFGRCMGERSDGKGFYSSTVLPWIWEDGCDWRITARARLDSFLFPECKCDSRTEETKVCDYHLELICQWELEDRRVMEHTRAEARKMPKVEEGGGVYPGTKPMSKDYPWVREFPAKPPQEARYICTVCGFGKDEGQAFNNPTYRNIFIRDHSHCGFGNPEKYAPPKQPKMSVSDDGLEITMASPAYRVSPSLLKELSNMKFHPGSIISATTPPEIIPEGKAFHLATAVCTNCFRGIYRGDDGLLYHLDLMRACHWSGTTVATA